MKAMLGFMALTKGHAVIEPPPCRGEMTFVNYKNGMDQVSEGLTHCRPLSRATVLPMGIGSRSLC